MVLVSTIEQSKRCNSVKVDFPVF